MTSFNEFSNGADKLAEQSIKDIKKSGKDWLYYVEKHPLQSMIFGTMIFYAFKGLFK